MAIVNGKNFNGAGMAGAQACNIITPTTAGVTPLLTASAMLSNCVPMAPSEPAQRAAMPSSKSNSWPNNQMPANASMPQPSQPCDSAPNS